MDAALARTIRMRPQRRASSGIPLSALLTRGVKLAAYQAAGPNRFSDPQAWLNSTPRQEGADQLQLVAQSRHAVANNPLARSAVNGFVREIVGKVGITSTAIARRPTDGRSLEQFNEDKNRLREEWNTNPELCDRLGRMTHTSLQDQVVRELKTAGEVLIVWSLVERAGQVGLVRESVSTEQLARGVLRDGTTGNRVWEGKEVDADGRIVAYHVNTDTGDGIVRGVARIPRYRVWQIYHEDRPGRLTGMPMFAPVLQELEWWKRYIQYTVLSAQAQACQSLAITRDPGTFTEDLGLLPEDVKDALANRQFELAPATVYDNLLPGEKIELLSPNQPQAIFGPFSQAMGAVVAAGLGLDVHRLTRDYSGGNYSSLRLAKIDFLLECAIDERLLVDQWLRLEDRLWTRLAIMQGLLEPPARYYLDPRWQAACLASDFKGNWSEWIDPLRDAQSEEQMLQNGTATLRQLCNLHGTDAEENIRQTEEITLARIEARARTLRRAQEIANELGVPLEALLKGITDGAAAKPSTSTAKTDGDATNGANNEQSTQETANATRS
jgi:lambda family phage portal protein